MERIDCTGILTSCLEPRGITPNKRWILENKKLIKPNNDVFYDQDVMEKLTSEIFHYVGIDCVKVSLGLDHGKKCCLIDNFLENNEELYSLESLDDNFANKNISQEDINNSFMKVILKISNLYHISVDETSSFFKNYIRIVFGDCLTGNADRDYRNIGLIFNVDTHKYRCAPSFDNAQAYQYFENRYNEGAMVAIASDEYPALDVIKFIVENYKEEISDILPNLENLVKYDLDKMLANYSEEISSEKRMLIKGHLTGVNNYLNQLQGKNHHLR